MGQQQTLPSELIKICDLILKVFDLTQWDILYNAELLTANFRVTQQLSRVLHDGMGAVTETSHREEKLLDQQIILRL